MERQECLLISLFLVLLSLLTGGAQAEDLVFCLSSGGIKNFTTYYAPTYPHLLDITIQNLRYAKPFVNKPAAIILPETTQQVATAIRCSRQGSWTIRLRSGGHSFEALSSRADSPFVIIDMMKLNRVAVDLKSETAWVEGGATIGEVYHAIATASDSHGFSAGLCPTVGTGGHFSGGGYGPLVRKYGLASDNIVDAILVDADGRVVDREAMGEDVFWAIRGGGGGSWGAVVGWKIKLLRVPKSVTAFRVPRTGSTHQMAKLWHKWQRVASSKLEDDFFLQLAVIPPGNQSSSITMVFQGMYLGSTSLALAAMDSTFPELGLTIQDCKNLSWAEGIILVRGDPLVSTVEDLKNRFGNNKTFTMTKSDYVVETPIGLGAIRGVLKMLALQPKASLLLDPYGGIMGTIRSDATPFPHRAGVLYSVEYFLDWQKGDDGEEDRYIDGIRRLYKYMTPFVAKNPRRAYVNNVDLDLGVMDWTSGRMLGGDGAEVGRRWGEQYFKGNYDRLVRVKTMIDPGNVFKHPQSIPTAFSLFKPLN